MNKQSNSFSRVEENRILHNKIADRYQHMHNDIFNPHEQSRIQDILSKACRMLKTRRPIALDFGCGSGNITKHLRCLGFRVVAADISDRFVDLLRERYRSDKMVEPYLLYGNANDLNGYRFDLICLYSVLHHLPDYLQALRSLAGRISHNGILFIDHEASEAFWRKDLNYMALQRETKINRLCASWWKLFTWTWYKSKYLMQKNARYQPEGDIHVWDDDHIEWQSIRRLLCAEGFEETYSRDYLVYRPYYPVHIFEKYAPLTSDMHCSLFQKLHNRL